MNGFCSICRAVVDVKASKVWERYGHACSRLQILEGVSGSTVGALQRQAACWVCPLHPFEWMCDRRPLFATAPGHSWGACSRLVFHDVPEQQLP